MGGGGSLDLGLILTISLAFPSHSPAECHPGLRLPVDPTLDGCEAIFEQRLSCPECRLACRVPSWRPLCIGRRLLLAIRWYGRFTSSGIQMLEHAVVASTLCLDGDTGSSEDSEDTNEVDAEGAASGHRGLKKNFRKKRPKEIVTRGKSSLAWA